MLVLWLEYIVVRPPRQRHWLLILTKNNSVAILTAVRITEHNGAYPKIMLIQDKQQEAAVDSALLGSQTNHGLTSHNGNFSTLCIHRILIIPAGFARSEISLVYWMLKRMHSLDSGTFVSSILWQEGGRAAARRSWLGLLPSLAKAGRGQVSPGAADRVQLFPCLLAVALQGLLALGAAKELLRMKPKGAACCVLVWAYSDEALGWAPAGVQPSSWPQALRRERDCHGLGCLYSPAWGSNSSVGCCLVLTQAVPKRSFLMMFHLTKG